MATIARYFFPPNSGLCEYCCQKPKHSKHPYCSKTCANQAAALCNHCHKKPKHGTFDYCGRGCAALAKSGGSHGGAPAVVTAPPLKYKNSKNAKANSPTAPNAPNVMAQQIPGFHALPPPVDPGVNLAPYTAAPGLTRGFSGGFNTGFNAGNFAPTPANYPPYSPISGATSYGLTGGGHIASPSFQHGAQTTYVPHNIGMSPEPLNDNTCCIPACGKAVHASAQGGKSSQFCSAQHRQEAVTSGLIPACIMCQTLPQSDDDYFCSRACRDESMSKNPEC